MKKTKSEKKGVAVVFGGSGFLGSHVADALTSTGYRVRIFDSKKSPYLQKGQEMITSDMLNAAAVAKAVKGASVIYNFAGIADLDDAYTKPLETVHLNVIGNLNVMDAAVKAKVRRYVYASTIYVYSDKGGFYRCSKQASELYIEEYHRRYGLDFTILRYSTLYGPRADQRNSVFRYLKQARLKKQLNCGGTGDEMREYIHVYDAAKLSVQILSNEFANDHVTISGHHPVKFRDMVSMINEMLGGKVKISYSKSRHPAHYDYTPYSYAPKIGHKLTHSLYIDMGQGLLESLHDMQARREI